MKAKDDATRMADLIYDLLRQMNMWGADFSVEKSTDRLIEVRWSDGSAVDIRTSIPKTM